VSGVLATGVALLAAATAWWGGGAVLEAMDLGVLGLPARLGLVFLGLSLAEGGLRRLGPTADTAEGDDHG